MTDHYPTTEHRNAASRVTEHFAVDTDTDAILLVNSCARGKATADSCLDIVILVSSDETAAGIEQNWERFYQAETVFQELRKVGQYSEVHLDVVTGEYQPQERGWTGGPDDFELQIGNHLAYGVPLWQSNDHFQRLRSQWLPYYGDALRRDRLAMVTKFCRNNLDHIPLYLSRGLHFQSFDRLYNAYREFLQALFIARRTYPIAHDKWIKEQIVGILGLGELYVEMTHLFQIHHFEGPEIGAKAETLRALLDAYVTSE